ncbi:MAG: TetR/AcrR family transcriptional regulator [Desulfocurvibacter africanus]
MSGEGGGYQPKQQRGLIRRERILDAALRLFSEKGYYGTNTKEIAKQAGVATGTLYRYFRDKKAVLFGVCMRFEARIMGDVLDLGRRLRDEGASPRKIMAAIVTQAVLAHHENAAFHREMLGLEILDDEVERFVNARVARGMDMLREFLHPMSPELRLKDLDTAVEMLFITIEAVAHKAVLFQSEVGGDKLLDALSDMLDRYLFE